MWHGVLASAVELQLELSHLTLFLFVTVFLGSAEATASPSVLALVEEVLLDLTDPQPTLYPRLKKIGGAEYTTYFVLLLVFLREEAVGTSSSVLRQRVPSSNPDGRYF